MNTREKFEKEIRNTVKNNVEYLFETSNKPYIKYLEEQIEQMKCCENCKHRRKDGNINGWSGFGCDDRFEECGDFNDDENPPTYKYWELRGTD